eukprot:3682810-Rhodomonas_salina.1
MDTAGMRFDCGSTVRTPARAPTEENTSAPNEQNTGGAATRWNQLTCGWRGVDDGHVQSGLCFWRARSRWGRCALKKKVERICRCWCVAIAAHDDCVEVTLSQPQQYFCLFGSQQCSRVPARGRLGPNDHCSPQKQPYANMTIIVGLWPP